MTVTKQACNCFSCLSPFLNKGMTFAIFHLPSTLLVDRDRYISFVKEGTMLAPASYNSFGLIPSGPVAFVVMMHSSILLYISILIHIHQCGLACLNPPTPIVFFMQLALFVWNIVLWVSRGMGQCLDNICISKCAPLEDGRCCLCRCRGWKPGRLFHQALKADWHSHS